MVWPLLAYAQPRNSTTAMRRLPQGPSGGGELDFISRIQMFMRWFPFWAHLVPIFGPFLVPILGTDLVPILGPFLVPKMSPYMLSI